jgi:hypothetical protein
MKDTTIFRVLSVINITLLFISTVCLILGYRDIAGISLIAFIFSGIGIGALHNSYSSW